MKPSDSADLHLFQELSTLGQQFAHALLFGQGRGAVKAMFPASSTGRDRGADHLHKEIRIENSLTKKSN
jgi:hypothetical protein